MEHYGKATSLSLEEIQAANVPLVFSIGLAYYEIKPNKTRCIEPSYNGVLVYASDRRFPLEGVPIFTATELEKLISFYSLLTSEKSARFGEELGRKATLENGEKFGWHR